MTTRQAAVLLALLALCFLGCASWLASLRCPESCPPGETVIHVPDACYCVPVPDEGDCRGPEDNEPPEGAPLCYDQGADPLAWENCWTCTGRSGGVWLWIGPEEEPK